MRRLQIAIASVATAGALDPPAGSQVPRFADPHRMLAWERDVAPLAIARGDVDGDGDIDFLLGYAQPSMFAVPAGRQNRLLLNDGSGRLTDATGNLPQLLDATRGVALGDADGDGDLDALIGNVGTEPTRLLVNDGSGVFSLSVPPFPVAAQVTYAAAFGDLDADGDLDLLTAAGSSGGIRLLLNDGSGAFLDASAQVPGISAFTLAVALGDLDEDGDVDAFAPLPSDRPLLNDGTGVFTLGTAPSASAPGFSTALALGDIDGDGDLDAVSAKDAGCTFVSCLGAQNRLYLNGGSANFTDFTVWLPAEVDRTTSVATGDVDGDGDLDLLFGNVGTCYLDLGCGYGEDRLYLNNGAGVYADASSQIPELDDWTDAVALADVDGDGDLDALLGTEGQEGLPSRLLLNDGAGVFLDASGENPASPFSTGALGVGLGDLDGDGDVDAFVSRGPAVPYSYAAYGLGNGVYLNDGAGRLLEAPVQPNDVHGMRLALGDVDGDGDLDALKVSGLDSGSLGFPRLYLNDGAAGFSLAPTQPGTQGVFMDVDLGDLDGDGDLDALFGMGFNPIASNNTARAYFNNGAGLFGWAPASTPSGITLTARAVALGDLDGDGDLDAYLGTGGGCTSSACAGQQDRLLLNNGTGLFTFALPMPLSPLDPTFAVALGDVDGDGDSDALVGNGGLVAPYPDRLYLNDGAGTFTNASNLLPADNDMTSAVAFGDADGDGDLDALIGAFPQNRLLLNGGSGTLTDATSSLPSVQGSATDVALGDVDGDGDLDAVLADSGELRVLSNLTRQLAWRALPRIGKPVTFDLYGPAWGAWFLVAAAGTGNTPLPPLGVIRIDLATLMPQFGGLLDAQGHVAVTYQVPAMPALVGQSLHWQAVVVGPARLTNLETTTFTNL